jgi:hypothetical protein
MPPKAAGSKRGRKDAAADTVAPAAKLADEDILIDQKILEIDMKGEQDSLTGSDS